MTRNFKCTKLRFHTRAIWNIYQILFLTGLCFMYLLYLGTLIAVAYLFPNSKACVGGFVFLKLRFFWNWELFFLQIWDIPREKKFRCLKRTSKRKVGSFNSSYIRNWRELYENEVTQFSMKFDGLTTDKHSNGLLVYRLVYRFSLIPPELNFHEIDYAHFREKF